MSVAIVNIVVPAAGEGPVVSIANLVGEKTVELSGTFTGRYVLLGSQDDVSFVPVLIFDANGEESIKLTLSLALKSVRVRSNAMSASGVTMNISGVSISGANRFTTLATLAPGASGVQPIIDLYAIFPPTGLEQDINYLCSGDFEGLIAVEGSLNGVNFNPIGGGGFRLGSRMPSLLTASRLEMSPLKDNNLIRYVRITVDGVISSQVVLTMGGYTPVTSGGTTPDIADWNDVRFIFVDGDNGDDSHIGYIDAPANTVFTPVQTVPVAIKTTSRLEEIRPILGANHKLVTLFKPRDGFAWYDHLVPGDELGRENREALSGYGYLLARGSDHTNSLADKKQLGYVTAVPGPNPDGSWTVSYVNDAVMNVAFPAALGMAGHAHMNAVTIRLTGGNFAVEDVLKCRLRSVDNSGNPTYAAIAWIGVRSHDVSELTLWTLPTNMSVGKPVWLEMPGVVLDSFTEATSAVTLDRSPLVLAGVQISGGDMVVGANGLEFYPATYTQVYIDGNYGSGAYSRTSFEGELYFGYAYQSEGAGVAEQGYGISLAGGASFAVGGNYVQCLKCAACDGSYFYVGAERVRVLNGVFEDCEFDNGQTKCDLSYVIYGTLALGCIGQTRMSNLFGVPEWNCAVDVDPVNPYVGSSLFSFENMWNLYAGGALEAEPDSPGIILRSGTYQVLLSIYSTTANLLLNAGNGVQIYFEQPALSGYVSSSGNPRLLLNAYASFAKTGFQIENGQKILTKVGGAAISDNAITGVLSLCPLARPFYRAVLPAGAPSNNPLGVGYIMRHGHEIGDKNLNNANYVSLAAALATPDPNSSLPSCYPIGITLTNSVQRIDGDPATTVGWVLLGSSGVMMVQTDPAYGWTWPSAGPGSMPVPGQLLYLSEALGLVQGAPAAIAVIMGIYASNIQYASPDYTMLPVLWQLHMTDLLVTPHTPLP